MGFHENILPPTQRSVVRAVASFCEERGFTLGGGTAIALQLGHRRSIDLDWFSPCPDFDPYEQAASLREAGVELAVTNIGHGALHLDVRGVGVSFIRYRYPTLVDPVPWPEYECHLASLSDLVCMKLSAVTQRGLMKDFFDIYAICSDYIPLGKALELYSQKFALEDTGHVLLSLCYFDDAANEPMPDLISAPPWEVVQDELRGWVRDLSRV